MKTKLGNEKDERNVSTCLCHQLQISHNTRLRWADGPNHLVADGDVVQRPGLTLFGMLWFLMNAHHLYAHSHIIHIHIVIFFICIYIYIIYTQYLSIAP